MRKTQANIESQEELLSTQTVKKSKCKMFLLGCNIVISYALVYGLGFGTNYIINKNKLCDGSL